jgi:adenosylcobinamide hydrolase
MFATRIDDGVLQARVTAEASDATVDGSDGTTEARWLATGQGGGYRRAAAAYNVSVPEGFDRTDIETYVNDRRERVGFAEQGPAMLTGVDLSHACGASAEPVRVVATAGVSNPATLPMDAGERGGSAREDDEDWRPGTVNLLVGTTRPLTDGGLATLLGTAVEAKTATLLATTGFTGTTSDAVIVGCVDGAEPAAFAGSATEVGDAARACVREAIRASLASRYGDETALPESVADADHGVETTRAAERFQP